MTGSPSTAAVDPVAAWFRKSGRLPPALRHVVHVRLPGGTLAVRTNSSAFRLYLLKRARFILAPRNQPADVTVDLYGLPGRWPALRPAASGSLETPGGALFDSSSAASSWCAWQPPSLMGWAVKGPRPRIRIVVASADPRRYRQPTGGLALLCHRDRVFFPDAWELALCLYARLRGLALIHGAVLERDGRGLLLVGDTGSGKTTTALALVRAGYRLLTDEYAVLWKRGPHRGRFSGIGVPPMTGAPLSADLHDLESNLGAVPSEKVPCPISADCFRHTPVPLRAVVVLNPPPRRILAHRSKPMEPVDVLVRLMAQVLDPIRGGRDDLMGALVGLAEAVPVFRVAAGTHLASLPVFIDMLADPVPPGKGRS